MVNILHTDVPFTETFSGHINFYIYEPNLLQHGLQTRNAVQEDMSTLPVLVDICTVSNGIIRVTRTNGCPKEDSAF